MHCKDYPETKKMKTISIDFPESAFSSLRMAPDDVSREIRIAAAVLWYQQGKISQEAAATISGLDRTDFLLAMARMGLDVFKVNFEELDKELDRG